MSDNELIKSVLITGGMSDIGRATAQAFAESGYNVIVNYRSHPDRAKRFVKQLQKSGSPKSIALQADIRNRAEVKNIFDQIYNVFKQLDVLVNNAGINRDNSFLKMTDEEWDTVIDTILKGNFICSQEFALRYKGDNGNIINIGAVTGVKGRKNGANYCSARAGVLVLTKCMALELAPKIRVNTVTPGCINTDELRTRYRLDDEQNLIEMKQRIPLGELGRPEDIAAMIIHIVSSGGYITGQNFFVDGGLFMR